MEQFGRAATASATPMPALQAAVASRRERTMSAISSSVRTPAMITHARPPARGRGALRLGAGRDILRGCLGAGCSLWDPELDQRVEKGGVSVIVHPPGSVGTSNSGPSFCPAGDEHDWRARCIGVLGRRERDAARRGPGVCPRTHGLLGQRLMRPPAAEVEGQLLSRKKPMTSRKKSSGAVTTASCPCLGRIAIRLCGRDSCKVSVAAL